MNRWEKHAEEIINAWPGMRLDNPAVAREIALALQNEAQFITQRACQIAYAKPRSHVVRSIQEQEAFRISHAIYQAHEYEKEALCSNQKSKSK